MPPPNVTVPHQQFAQRCGHHSLVVGALPHAAPALQRLVAELVMMRLFDEFQEALAGVAYRLACGATYADGTAPTLLVAPARSTDGARALFEQYGRARPKFVKWSRVSFINETTRFVLDPSNPFLTACSANALTISEMQAVRNRIAHKNDNSRASYSTVVLRHYGARLNHVSPGVFLLSPRFAPTMLERYIAACRIIIKNCSRA